MTQAGCSCYNLCLLQKLLMRSQWMFIRQSFNFRNGEKTHHARCINSHSAVCSGRRFRFCCGTCGRSCPLLISVCCLCSLPCRVRGEHRGREEPGVSGERTEADPGSAGEFLRRGAEFHVCPQGRGVWSSLFLLPPPVLIAR